MELVQERKSIKEMLRKGADIQKEIEALQETLKNVEKKCEEKHNVVTELESEYEGCKEKLIMAEKTLKTLTQSKDRVKMIVNNLIPSLNLDD